MSLEPAITVVGSFVVDRIGRDACSPGGCPSFAEKGLIGSGVRGRVVTRRAVCDCDLFDPVIASDGVEWCVLDVEETPAFTIRDEGDSRAMHISAVCAPWTIEDLDAAQIDTEWVHLAPIVGGEFGPEVVAWLVSCGHQVSLDGQGLVRGATVGPLVLATRDMSATLASVHVLKLAAEEADALVGAMHTDADMAALRVREVLVTRGSAGCALYLDGNRQYVPSGRAVRGVHATGAGDAFTVAYVAGRARGLDPVTCVVAAAARVAAMLEERLELAGS